MSHQDLFGGSQKWDPADWTASDDSVRGGKSQSYLDVPLSEAGARFYGVLDIGTLGGAGFASQRTRCNNRKWDLSSYDGIQLDVKHSDGKRYTLILKDRLLPKNAETGREQATISYEYDFQFSMSIEGVPSSECFIPWDAFRPTYRGKEIKDAPKLNTKEIRRFSVMMRSFFGDQEGSFSLTVGSISAVTTDTSRMAEAVKTTSSDIVS
ncbi:NADH:ubiquinone oxidoreductase complex I intermediate-associated protein 30 [Trichodelitschia bisporula]|uniref:NADH:ubiquinone oxidoreductase complex I intermediate-associated protein 30 n=1 Tax=Trichodelitschia bisporula TaxID=703511 RepID=A0A6G1HYS7_9PEZI|nr:NADH:ubiquinone oxidoreductase complex I intermediate-associated protein 30 [Trichodelitschia bisporula]